MTFHVGATNVASYQWQYLKNGTWYAASGTGNKTDTMTYVVNAVRLTFDYRCRLKDEDGNVVYTDTFKIVESAIVIDDVTYNPLTSTTCAVVSYAGTAASLTIPETVDGMTVTEIGVEAFMDNKTLTSIDLPDTITVIRARAFKGCTSLSDMH